MKRSHVWVLAVSVTAVLLQAPPTVRAQDRSDLSGHWTLNRALSQFPREIGFTADWASAAGDPVSPATAGRGRRGAGPVSPFGGQPESEDDAKRLQQLTAEVRNPPAMLTIAQTAGAITITDDRGRSRTFHPTGREEEVPLDGVSVGATARMESGQLVILYSVERGRDLRYALSRVASPPQLIVDVQFVERGGGDRVRRVYEPASSNAPPPNISAAGQAPPTAPPTPTPPASPAVGSEGGFNQQPDAELKGLTILGIVVEEFTAQAAACGLNRDTLEAVLSKRLSDAGFVVRRNSDEDTYLYVTAITTSASNGLCVSRYDAFLYTHTTARLSYQQTPVLVQVSLLHKGGIAGGAPAAHAESVVRGLQEYVDQFSTRIHNANKQTR